MGAVGLVLSRNNISIPLNLNAVPLTLFFCCIGYCIKNYIINYLKNLEKINFLYSFIILSVSLLLLSYLSDNLYVNVGINSYSNFFVLLITTTIGVLFTFTLSSIISNISILKLTCQSIGLHTMAILGWHFFAFKLTSLIIIYISNKSILYLGAFPVMDSDYWLYYTISGVFIPILLVKGKNFFKKSVFYIHKRLLGINNFQK